jgi:hypothetical protein
MRNEMCSVFSHRPLFLIIVSITPQAIQRLLLLSGYNESKLGDDDGKQYSSSLRIAWVFRLYVCRLSPRS